MGQEEVRHQEEEHHLQEEAPQDPTPAVTHRHSRQEEQAFQEEHPLVNLQVCSILDMQQLLESWYDKSTFAIATWRGDAQRYWLVQVLDLARSRHDVWLQSTPSQRASLEPA